MASETPDQPTQFAADLIDSATTEGARVGRSPQQQLDHWARVGRAIDLRGGAARRRIEAATAGTLPTTELNDDEMAVLNAEIDATIEQRAREMSFGDHLAAEGITTVALDETGAIVKHTHGGTQTTLDPQGEPGA